MVIPVAACLAELFGRRGLHILTLTYIGSLSAKSAESNSKTQSADSSWLARYLLATAGVDGVMQADNIP